MAHPQLGGVVIFFVDSAESRDALYNHSHLIDWKVDSRPLIFAYNPAVFDAQIAYTQQVYRNVNWNKLRTEECPAFGNAQARGRNRGGVVS